MKKNNIYILSEYFKREFHSNILVSLLAANKNFNIYIGSDRVYKKLIKQNLLSPGIFHTKSISHGKKKTIFNKTLYKKKFILTSIDEEHGVLDTGSFEDLFIKPRMNKEDLKYFDAIFCWGNYDYKKFVKFFKLDKKFFLTGSPRVDLWKKNFNSIWHQKNDDKKNILIVSNFSFSNNLYSLSEIIRRKENEGYYKRSPKLKKQELSYYSYQKKLIYKFIDLIAFLSKELSSEKILFRPHPTENINFWKKELQIFQNVEICEKGVLSTLISKSDIIIQNGCTSSLEAFISGKRVIDYHPIQNTGNKFGEFAKEFSINAKNKEQVIKIILSKNKTVNKLKQKKVNNRMIYLDKVLSSEKIVKIWRKLIPNGFNYFDNNHLKIRLNLFLFDFFNYYITLVILILKRKQHLKNIIFHKFSGAQDFVINKYLLDLKKILKIKKNIKISRLGKEFISITSK